MLTSLLWGGKKLSVLPIINKSRRGSFNFVPKASYPHQWRIKLDHKTTFIRLQSHLTINLIFSVLQSATNLHSWIKILWKLERMCQHQVSKMMIGSHKESKVSSHIEQEVVHVQLTLGTILSIALTSSNRPRKSFTNQRKSSRLSGHFTWHLTMSREVVNLEVTYLPWSSNKLRNH